MKKVFTKARYLLALVSLVLLGTNAAWAETETETYRLSGSTAPFSAGVEFQATENVSMVVGESGNTISCSKRTNNIYTYKAGSNVSLDGLIPKSGNYMKLTPAIAGTMSVTYYWNATSEKDIYVIEKNPADADDNGQTIISSKTKDAKGDYTIDFAVKANNAYYIYVTGSGAMEYYGFSYTHAPSIAPVITASGATIIATESNAEVTKEISVTGANLEGETLTATLSPEVSGLTVTLASSSIVDGAIETTATLHYTSTENASGSTTLTLSDGTTSKDVTITYKAIVTPSALRAVGQKTTWDWTSWTEELELKGDGTTTPAKTDEYTYSDIAAMNSLTIPSGFDGDGIMFKGTYPVRNKKTQSGTWTIQVAFPGTLEVTFSDTGSGFGDKTYDDYDDRYLNINGTNTEYYTHRDGSTSDSKTGTVNIEVAGKVAITGMKEDGTTPVDIVVTKIVYTPSVDATFVDVTDKLYRTFASSSALDFTGGVAGLTAYRAVVKDDVVSFVEIEGEVPEKEGMLIKVEAAGRYFIPKATGTPSKIDNAFTGVTGGTDKAPKGSFVLYNGELGIGFYKTTAEEFTVGANTAYISADKVSEARTFISLDGETTGIDAAIVNNEKAAGVYNLNGQRVAQPTKGLYIVNGKKVVIK